MKSQFIIVDKVMVNREVVETPFCCDLEKCKGACCTLESDFGAPLLPEEIPVMRDILPEVLPYLPEGSKEEISENGFYEDKSGDLVTRSINSRDCVFVYYDGDIARCAIERAWLDGKIAFQKPVSCHLFPIRVAEFGGDILRYERFSECRPALRLGEETGQTIAEFCESALTRKYGAEWYQKLRSNFPKK